MKKRYRKREAKKIRILQPIDGLGLPIIKEQKIQMKFQSKGKRNSISTEYVYDHRKDLICPDKFVQRKEYPPYYKPLKSKIQLCVLFAINVSCGKFLYRTIEDFKKRLMKYDKGSSSEIYKKIASNRIPIPIHKGLYCFKQNDSFFKAGLIYEKTFQRD